MKRLTFLGTLFGLSGITKAQQWKECVPAPTVPSICTDKMKPALNNQCPVCGTMAKAYGRPTSDLGLRSNCHIVAQANTVTGHDNTVICDPAKMVPWGPTEHLTRCKRCNAAFYQDATQ